MNRAVFCGPIIRIAEFQASTAATAPMTMMNASSGQIAPTSPRLGVRTQPATAATSVIAMTDSVPGIALSVV